MRIDIIFPKLPPSLDGIGDHTAHIAREMARSCDVRVITAQQTATPIPSVRIETGAFDLSPMWNVSRCVDAVAADPPDWVVLQFNQFSYGRWGLNPFLPQAVRRLKARLPGVKVAWMAHEDFVPASSLKFAIMRQWQRRQFRALGRAADHVFFSIDPWVQTYGPWFPDTPVDHFPIGSNMPRVDADPGAIRAAHDLRDTFVVGFFGTARARRMGHVRAAVDAIRKRTDRVTVLAVGPCGPDLRKALPGTRVVDAGRLPAADVSRHLAFMAGLQHGVPTVATDGPLTDRRLRSEDGTAFCLAPTTDAQAFADAAVALYDDPVRRTRMSRAARSLYDTAFDFAVTVPDFLAALSSPAPAPVPDEADRLYAHR